MGYQTISYVANMLKYQIVRNNNNNYVCYYRYGACHRADGPALLWGNPLGDISYWQYAKRHRKNGYALICKNRNERWIWGNHVKI